MVEMIQCPICGNYHERTYEIEEFWGGMITSEDFFNCPDCGYWYGMAYSDYYDGIDLRNFKQLFTVVKNWKKIRYLGIKFKKYATSG